MIERSEKTAQKPTQKPAQSQLVGQSNDHKLIVSFYDDHDTGEYEEIPISDEELFKLAAPVEEDELCVLCCEDPDFSEYEAPPISDDELLELAMPTKEELALQNYDDYDIEEEIEDEFYYNYIPDDYYYNNEEDEENGFDFLNGLGTYGAWK